MNMELNPEEKRQFDEHDKWLMRIANGCEHMRSPKFVSIPTGLPTCSETDKPCRFDICPKRGTKQKEGKK